MTYIQLTLVEETSHDWIEETSCERCGHHFVVHWPKRLFGQKLACPECDLIFIASSAALRDWDDYLKDHPDGSD